MAADVELNVRVSKKGDGADAVARDLRGAARAADELGDQLSQVERKLLEVRALSAAAGKEFLKTGDISPLKQLLKDERQLKQVEKSIQGVTGEVKNLEKAGEGVGDIFGRVGRSAVALASNPEIALAGAAIGGALVAGASAVIVGASLATTAAAGLAGGILLAAKDERVNAAWVAFGKEAGQNLQDASAVFVQPLVGAAQHVGDAFHDTLPLIEKDFAALAPVVDHLGTGAAGLIRSLGPGLSNALQAGAPILEKVTDELPALGAAVGVFFTELSQGAQGGAEALMLTLKGVEFGVEAVGGALRDGAVAFDLFGGASTKAFLGLQNGNSLVHAFTDSALLQLTGKLLGADDATKKHASSTDDLFKKMQAAADAAKAEAEAQRQMKADIDAATNAIKNQIGGMLGLDGATDSFNKSVLNLKDSLTQNGRTLDQHTAKGLANRDAVLQGVQSAEKLREEMINSGQSTAYANQVYEQNIQQLRGVYGNTKAAAAAVDELIGKYGNLSRAPNIAKEIKITERFVTVGRSAVGNVSIGGQGFQGAAFALGGPVKAPVGQPVPAIVHGGEYVLSTDMLAGRQPIDIPGMRDSGLAPRVPLAGTPASGGGMNVSVSIAAGPSAGGGDAALLSWFGEALRGGRLQLRVSNGGRVVPV